MFANVATVRRALLFLAANILLSVGWSGHLGAQPAPAKVVAITAAHTEGLSYLDANRVRTSAQMIASRLADLGALSYRADANGACETKSLSAEPK